MSILPQTNLRRARPRRASTRPPAIPRGPGLPRIPRWSVGGIVIALIGSAFVLAQRTQLPHEAVVARVIDGDTIELASGQRVRYIGVDTPETHRRDGGRWVTVHEAYGKEAEAFNRELVEGKHVRLEYDVQPRDKYNRLLAYIYVGDTFVNAELLRQGYAHQLTIPPDVKYAEQFRALVREAREAQRGLWR